jgi:hypothetical protein
MQKEAMIKCLVNGKVISLTKAGFEMAKAYFGAVPAEEVHEIPIELRQPLIIPSKPLKVEQKVEIPIEIIKTVAAKEPEVEPQITTDEIKPVVNQEIKPEVAPAKTIVRRPRKGGKK